MTTKEHKSLKEKRKFAICTICNNTYGWEYKEEDLKQAVDELKRVIYHLSPYCVPEESDYTNCKTCIILNKINKIFGFEESEGKEE